MPFRRAPSCATAPGIRVKNRGPSGGCQFLPPRQTRADKPECDREGTLSPSEDQSVNKRLIVNLCKYAVALVLLGLVIGFNWKKGEDTGLWFLWNKHVIQGEPVPGPQFFAFALLIGLASVLLSFIRWYVLVRAVDLPFRVSDALRLGMVGFFFISFLPGSVGGDLLKAAFLAREHDRRTVAVATVVMDRMFALWALIWFVAVVGGVSWLAGQFQSDTAEVALRFVLGAAAFCGTSLLVWF